MNERIQPALNQAESSASFMNSIVKQVKQGSQSRELFSLTAQSVSTSSCTYKLNCNVSSLLSRKLMVQLPVTFVVPTQAAAAQAGNVRIRDFFLCLRPDALNRIITSAKITLNGTTFNCQPQLISEVVEAYDRDGDHLHNSSLSICANTPDFRFLNDETNIVGGNTAAGVSGIIPDESGERKYYHWRSIGDGEMYAPRGSVSFVKTGTTVTGADVGADTVDKSVSIRFDLYYALKLPLFNGSELDFLPNIADCVVDLTFGSSNILNRCFLHPRIYRIGVDANTIGAEITNYGAGLGVRSVASTFTDVSFTLSSTDFKISGFNVHPSHPDLIPQSVVVHGQEFMHSIHEVGAIAAGASQSIVHPLIDVRTTPSHIFLQVIPTVSDRNSKRSTYHAKISNLVLDINGQNFSLAQYEYPRFYQMCVKNGLKMRYIDFNPDRQYSLCSLKEDSVGAGAPLCFRVSEDLGQALVEGVQKQFQLQVKYTATSTSNTYAAGGAATAVNLSYRSIVTLVYPCTFQIERGKNIVQTIGIPQQDYDAVVGMEMKMVSGLPEDEAESELIGGSWKSFVRGTKNFFHKLTSAASPILQNLAQQDPRVARAAEASQMINSMTGSGLLGGNLLAGAKLAGSDNVTYLKRMGLVK